MDRRLKDSRPAESAAAAAEFVALTNNSSKDEDVVIGKTGALEVAFSGVYFSPPTRWSSRVSLTPDSGVLRDQSCTTQGPKMNSMRRVDF